MQVSDWCKGNFDYFYWSIKNFTLKTPRKVWHQKKHCTISVDSVVVADPTVSEEEFDSSGAGITVLLSLNRTDLNGS